ncbi:hypothetical protein AB0A63_24630 [Lentzea sp. NPDC042327]|uniref:hypothetical protein n=1 Tax=Lentzea sp. NPDC042327 TaxID=3154801 RepID=UPI0033C692AC
MKPVVALCVVLLGVVIAGFVIALPVPEALFAVLIVVLSLPLSGYLMAKARPGTTAVLAAPIAVLVVAALSGTGGHSLWLTVFGEKASWAVTAVNTHVGRRSPTSYSNSLACGAHRVEVHTPSSGKVNQPGVPTAATTAVAFVLMVLRWPRREPRAPNKQKIRNDFL